MAIAGIVLGSISILLGIFWVIAIVASSPS